ncbi:VF530 family protein [Simiduia curdlanivorans]|uniref:VF530 family protein n=1 Tax=Simiduia curdlanivorans TaxID=1492769 RepID=A0ABV8V531_9GAMM|nr:VF530 family protein [Simiduia curdlanivorans]MDN3638357.1 VF530 family protein [Simiduia curdlanivorans]
MPSQPPTPKAALPQANNPLHGITLENILISLEQRYGWDGLAQRININCFKSDPSIKSSLKFLRKTPWAREKVEQLYIASASHSNPWNNP